MWDLCAMRSSWVVVAVGACACSAHEPAAGVSRQQVTQDPLVVGKEIATDPPVSKATDVGHNPVVASDGSGFLAVQEVSGRIRAVRVGPTGATLDSPWLDLGEATADQYYPSVVFGGGHYFVTWSAFLHDGDSTIEGRFVKPNGEVEGSANLTLASEAIYPSVGWNGARFQMSYLSLEQDGSQATITSFEASGAPVAGSTHALSATGSLAYPRLAASDQGSLVAWEAYTHDDVLGDVGTIHGAHVDASGVPDVAGELQLSAQGQGAGSVGVAAGAAGFLAVWQTSDSPRVLGSVVSTSGEITSQGFAISHSSTDSGLPSVAFDGNNYLVAWADGRDENSVYGNRVSQSAVVASATDTKLATGSPRYVAFGSDRTALAWNGSEFLLSFLGYGIEGSLIASNLSLVNGQIALTGLPNKQGYPSSVWNGQNYLVVWTDERSSDTDMDLRGVRVGTNGQLLDPQGLALSAAESPAFGAQVASAKQGSSLLVWFNVSGKSFERTIASDGTLGAIMPFREEETHSSPGLASNGSGYLASYETGDSSDDGAVVGRLLDLSGTSSPDFAIDSSTLNSSPSVFAIGANYLVSYPNNGTWLMPVSGSGVHGQGELLSPSLAYVTVAASGTDSALVVWSNVGDTQIHARSFQAGKLGGDTLDITESSAGYGAAVAWDGASFWATWETPEHHLQARAIGTDGAFGPVSMWVDQECFAPVLSSDGQGQLLLSYTKYLEQSQTRRVFSRLVGRGADADPGTGGTGGTAGANGGVAGGAGTATMGGVGGTSSGGMSSGGATSAGAPNGGMTSGGASTGGTAGTGGSSNGGAGGSGTGPKPVPRCTVNAPGSDTSSGGAMGLALGLFATALLRRRRTVQPAAK
jgi:MYXO-CTERM domain-containing protein